MKQSELHNSDGKAQLKGQRAMIIQGTALSTHIGHYGGFEQTTHLPAVFGKGVPFAFGIYKCFVDYRTHLSSFTF